MKLIIQICCLNEEQTLPLTLSELPRHIEGITQVEWLVVDDGCSDRTVEVAQRLGVDHIIRHKTNKGFAAAFQTGLDSCLRLGADIIVNTEGDNQYPGRYIPELVEPVVDGGVDIVIADRQTDRIAHFSPLKKGLQRLGSRIVSFVANAHVPDAASGFCALSREAALHLRIMSNYEPMVELLIQAHKKKLALAYLPIITHPQTRESRLMRNLWHYVWMQAVNIVHLFFAYAPFRAFMLLGSLFLALGVGLFVLFPQVRGYPWAVPIGAGFVICAVGSILAGFTSQILVTNRRLHEETLYHLRRLAFDQTADTAGFPPSAGINQALPIHKT